MNDATWHLVNSTPRVIEFLGNNNPVVLSEAEVASIMAQMEQGSEKPRPKIEFEIGEEIRVKNGPFKDFNGRIEAVDYDKSRLQVFVSIFSRETLVDLDFNEVEKSKKILACRLHTDFFGGIVHAFLTHTWGAQAIERMNP